MANLNLGVFLDETYDIQLDLEGKNVLKIKKPAKAMAIKIAALQSQEHKQDSDYMESLYSLAKYILNWNTEGTDQTTLLDSLPLNAVIAIVQGYTEFMSRIEKDPN